MIAPLFALVAALVAAAPSSRAACPAGTKRIEGGRYTRADGTKVVVSAFCMDVTEVTAAAYAECVAGGACGSEGLECSSAATYEKPGRAHHPINCVTWFEADAFCRDLNKRLPTEDEWEWAARGQRRGAPFPWGDAPPADRVCWDGTGNALGRGERKGTCPVRTHPRGEVSGIADLAGNVREWTATEVGQARIVRGGSWGDTEPSFLEAAFRGMNAPDERLELTGFRCVSDPGVRVVDAAARAKERARVRAAKAKAAGPFDVTGVRIWR